ncbi:MAG: indolepyruvate oxidoreductase subunit beta [Clostridiales bacterium]|nr:indolepyruvate oxidoreductase subunit beta [Clostridiales bacterium]
MNSLNIMVVGVGGQGTLLTSRIIGRVALSRGYDVKMSEVHGMAQRGGSVVTFVRFAKTVREPIVEEGDADLLISFEKLEALRYAHFLKKSGKIIVNDCTILPMTVVTGAASYPDNIIETLKSDHDVTVIDGNKIAAELGNSKVSNSAVLGAAARVIGFEKDIWLSAIEQSVPPKTIDINKKAFLMGYGE